MQRRTEKFDRKSRPRRKPIDRQRMTARFQIPADAHIDYKNVGFLQRYVTDRGKILSRRLSGIGAKDQRKLAAAIKKARFLALLPTGGVRK